MTYNQIAWHAQVCESSAIYKLHAFLEPYNFTLTKFEDMRIAQSGYGTGEEMGCHTAKYFLMDNGLLWLFLRLNNVIEIKSVHKLN